MTTGERQEKIKQFKNAGTNLEQALQNITGDEWSFHPKSNEWSINEIVQHLADAEAMVYIRFRKGIAEPSQPIFAFDDKEWSEDLHYDEQNPTDAVAVFKTLRHSTAKLLLLVPEDIWNTNTIIHPDMGAMTLDDMLTYYEKYTNDFISKINSIHQHYKK